MLNIGVKYFGQTSGTFAQNQPVQMISAKKKLSARMKRGTVLLTTLLMTACGGGSSQGGGQETQTKNLAIVGSDTEVNVVQQLAETFMEKDSILSISVTGGGSGAGINALIKGSADIANSSREMTAAERQRAEQKGMALKQYVFGKDAVAIVTHPKCPVEALTLDQIGRIFKGEITNWKEVGGFDAPISMYGRQSSSGTFIFIRENVLQGDYAPSVKRMNGNAQIVEAVKQDTTSIGYVGIGYVVNAQGNTEAGVSPLQIRSINGEDTSVVDPAERQAVRDGRYPLSRPLYQYFEASKTELVKPFLQYETSEQGQEIVRKNGFYQIDEDLREQNQQNLSTSQATAL